MYVIIRFNETMLVEVSSIFVLCLNEKLSLCWCDQLWAGHPASQRDREPAKPGASEPSRDLQKSGAKSQGRNKPIPRGLFFSTSPIRT